MKMQALWLIALSSVFALPLTAEDNYSLRGVADKADLNYQLGEPAVFTLQLYNEDEKVDAPLVKYTILGDGGFESTGEIKPVPGEAITITATLDRPGALRLIATACNEAGEPLPQTVDLWGTKIDQHAKFDGGVFFDAASIVRDGEEPADFDEFWQKQLELLKATPLEVLSKVEIPTGDPNTIAYDIKLACPGSAPTSGILTMPRNAEPGSLTAMIGYHGYAVISSNVNNPNGKDKIFFDVNAHGIDNLQPQSYYQELAKGRLDSYALNTKDHETPETSYFRDMILRDLRAVEFIQTLPEWDGKNLHLDGSSQGGFQSIAVASLSPAVTHCYAGVPWMANVQGARNGRMGGFAPHWTPALPYYDTASFAKRIHCPLVITTGMGDYTCPPSSVVAIYNNVPSNVVFTIHQDVDHSIIRFAFSQQKAVWEK